MPESDDPVVRANQALQTAIGSKEIDLRALLGDAGYEIWLDRHNRSEEAAIERTVLHNDESAARSMYISAKAGFWRAGTSAIVVATGLGIGWSIWEWLR